MRGALYLVGSGQDGLLARVASRAYRALGKSNARVAVSYAPVCGDARGLKFMHQRMGHLFPNAVCERFAVEGEDGAMSPSEARAVVDRADLVFISGGDPTMGAKVLERGGASGWLRAVHSRGVPMIGVSAGSIALGAWWADWPEDEDGDEDSYLARTGLIACIGAASAYVFDTHNEEDDWDELRLVAKLCDRHGQRPHFLGIPSGGAIVIHGDGAVESIGKPTFSLAV